MRRTLGYGTTAETRRVSVTLAPLSGDRAQWATQIFLCPTHVREWPGTPHVYLFWGLQINVNK